MIDQILIGILYIACGPLLWVSDTMYKGSQQYEACQTHPTAKCESLKICSWGEDGLPQYCSVKENNEKKDQHGGVRNNPQ